MTGTPTLTERETRIAADDGDGDTTVYLSANKTAGHARKAYHIDRDCQYHQIIDEPQAVTRAAAQRRGDYPCKLCVLDDRAERDGEMRECPYCGADTGDFSRHLPCEGVDDD